MEWLAAISQTVVARSLTASPTLYLLINAAHIMGIAILFGAILALDLRLLGIGRALPIAPAALYLSRLSATGLALAVATGLCLFSVRPVEYAANAAFLSKLALVGLGVVNILLIHRSSGWRRLRAGADPSATLRLGATISILIWTGAIIAGRWIGFL